MSSKPSFCIPGYLSRWHVIPRNRFFNVYLHRFDGSDDDRALHDHPWFSVSFLLRGHMVEHYRCKANEADFERSRWIPWLRPVFRSPRFAHRLELHDGPAWTLFITGPKVRDWGFWCKSGWVNWRRMATKDGRRIGGCE